MLILLGFYLVGSLISAGIFVSHIYNSKGHPTTMAFILGVLGFFGLSWVMVGFALGDILDALYSGK